MILVGLVEVHPKKPNTYVVNGAEFKCRALENRHVVNHLKKYKNIRQKCWVRDSDSVLLGVKFA